MQIIMVDSVVKTDVPGMSKRRFESVRAALDWVELQVQTKPAFHYRVTITDVYQLFDPEQQKLFKFVYDVPAKFRRSYFSLSGNQGPLITAAMHFWWAALGPDLQKELEQKPGELIEQMKKLQNDLERKGSDES